MRKNPAEVAQKWARNTTAAVPDFRAGVQRVSEAPGIRAAAAVDRYQAGIERSIAEGKWQRNTANVSLSDWQRATMEVGAGRIAGGVAAAEGKVQTFMNELLPYQESIINTLDSSMPRGDLETNIQRAAEFARAMSRFRRGGM